jgi:hypothetical protein
MFEKQFSYSNEVLTLETVKFGKTYCVSVKNFQQENLIKVRS